jgi:hypothetical protein
MVRRGGAVTGAGSIPTVSPVSIPAGFVVATVTEVLGSLSVSVPEIWIGLQAVKPEIDTANEEVGIRWFVVWFGHNCGSPSSHLEKYAPSSKSQRHLSI